MKEGIPRQFKLGGHTIKVKTISAKKWPHGEHILAIWMPSEMRIEMISSLEGTVRQQVFLHEAVHAILDVASYRELSENEDFVDRFSIMLHMMLTTMR